MLKVAKHFCEVLRPQFQLMMVFDRHAQYLGSHDARQRHREIGNHVHAGARFHLAEQTPDDLADVAPQHFHTLRRERSRREAADARMRRRIQKKHLLHHHLRDRIQRGQAHRRELCRRGRTHGGKIAQHPHYIRIAGDDPCVQKRIPVHRVFAA